MKPSYILQLRCSWNVCRCRYATSTAAGDAASFQQDSYQYLERSRMPTMHFQKSLPRLPIPKLSDTCRRYLDGIRPILAEEKYRSTERIVHDFEKNHGPELQAALVAQDKANKHTSYITEPWFDMYLRAREPVVVNYTPFMCLDYDPIAKYNDQLTRATNFIISCLRFKRSLQESVLRPEVFHLSPKKSDTNFWRNVCQLAPNRLATYASFAFKAFPLDMSQFPSLFGTSRIPRLDKDELVRHPESRHIVVMRKGHLFEVNCITKDGYIRPPAEVGAALSHILSLGLTTPKHPIAVFTTQERDQWARTREVLLESSSANAEALEKVDRALFCVSLDDEKLEDPHDMVRNFLHGDGTNRWFDKSFSLLIDKGGLTCVIFEHSWGDGVAVLRLIEDIFKETTATHFVSPEDDFSHVEVNRDLVQEIEFELPSASKGHIDEAMTEFKAVTDSLGIHLLEYRDLNRVTIKGYRLSPDAIMQLAIQMAYHRQVGIPAATYESCSTSVFKHGRTETMRPATNQTNEFVERFFSASPPSKGELKHMITEASKRHFQLVKEASMGQGFDRHLYGLQHIAEEAGLPTAPIFNDPNFDEVNRFIVSTSTLSTNTIILGGFGPVVADGYGIGYNIGTKRLGYVVSTYKAKRNGAEFVDCLKHSMDDIREILQ